MNSELKKSLKITAISTPIVAAGIIGINHFLGASLQSCLYYSTAAIPIAVSAEMIKHALNIERTISQTASLLAGAGFLLGTVCYTNYHLEKTVLKTDPQVVQKHIKRINGHVADILDEIKKLPEDKQDDIRKNAVKQILEEKETPKTVVAHRLPVHQKLAQQKNR